MRTSRSVTLSLATLASLGLTACGDKGAAIEPPLAGEGGGKADVADRVPVRGALAVGGEARAAFAEDLEFHGYTLDVRAGGAVTLEVSHAGTSRALDATLYVYGPEQAGAYGSEAIAFDDDSGWGDNPRLRDLALDAGGRYLVVVGSHDGRGRGRYRLTATCPGGDCAPGACHPAIAADIAACVVDFQSDPENWNVPALDVVDLCGDAEPVADVHDAVCAAAGAPAWCALSYEDFAAQELPACVREGKDAILDATCVFGSTYRDLATTDGLHVTGRRKLTSVAGLPTLVRQQIVLAVQASSHDDVTTAEEALARVDQQEINQVDVWDATGRRAFTVYEYGAGDNSYGRYFVAGTTTTVATIHDGDLEGCGAMRGDELRACATADDCRGELACVGVAEPFGRGSCVGQVDSEAEGRTCGATDATACPAGEGLLCAGLSDAESGLCLAAWMRRSFATVADAAIPDNRVAGVSSQLYAYGLGEVDVDVWISLAIEHPRAADLVVTLTNPAGTAVAVDASAGVSEGGLELERTAVTGFSGDEQVNGVWTLTVVDGRSGKVGKLATWGLTIGSRRD